MTNSKVYYFIGHWTTEDVMKNPKWLFIYGDNDVKLGYTGQAVIRDYSNTVGIPVKKYPSFAESSYYTDDEYDDNVEKITEAINEIIKRSQSYAFVILSEDGIGTGLSKLEEKAPKTFKFLKKSMNDMIKTINKHNFKKSQESKMEL